MLPARIMCPAKLGHPAQTLRPVQVGHPAQILRPVQVVRPASAAERWRGVQLGRGDKPSAGGYFIGGRSANKPANH